MAVIKNQRCESTMQFLETAMKLELYAIKYCVRFPKRYMFIITKDLVDLSKSVYNHAKSANSIYPTNANEMQLRINHIISAICDLQCLTSQIEVAMQLITQNDKHKAIKTSVWVNWNNLIIEELRLLKALKNKCVADQKGYEVKVIR